MYKYLIFCVLLALGCRNNSSNNGNVDTIRPGDIDTVVQTMVVDTSLTGIYRVKLPCSDCEGREHTLALFADGEFKLQETFIGKSLAPAVTRGKWWRNGDEVQLMDGSIVINTYELHRDTLFIKSPEADSYNYPRFALHKANSLVPKSWERYRDSGVVFMAAGTEPFWGLKIRDNLTIDFEQAGKPAVTVQAGKPNEKADSTVYSANLNPGMLQLIIYPRFCSDGMSSIIYQYQVQLQYDTLRFSGCGSYLQQNN